MSSLLKDIYGTVLVKLKFILWITYITLFFFSENFAIFICAKFWQKGHGISLLWPLLLFLDIPVYYLVSIWFSREAMEFFKVCLHFFFNKICHQQLGNKIVCFTISFSSFNRIFDEKNRLVPIKNMFVFFFRNRRIKERVHVYQENIHSPTENKMHGCWPHILSEDKLKRLSV